jgi:hypothetical protein
MVRPEPLAAPSPASEPCEGAAAPCASMAPPVDARAQLLGRLAGELAALAAAGDLDGCRILNETIGALLSRPAAPPEGSAEQTRDGAAVVDLAAYHRSRGR